MKKTLIAITVLSLFAGCATLSSQAVTLNNPERGYVSVNTTANTEVAPDVAEISFAVQTSDAKSMQKATTQNKEISDQVFAQLKSMIDTNNGDYIKTADFSASPIYTYTNSKKNFDRYEVSNRVIVHTKSIDKVGKMIDSAIAAGATNVDNLTFSVSNYEAQCNDLISIASEKAQKRAGVIAKTLSTTVDGVRTFDVSCNANNYSAPRFYMAKNMLAAVAEDTAASEGSATTISNGVVKINANVNATFFVK